MRHLKVVFIVLLSVKLAFPQSALYYYSLVKQANLAAAFYIPDKDASRFKPKSTTQINMGQFDFIIVGAGAAGPVIANRLTETNYTVLLIEAGKFANEVTDVPALGFPAMLSEYNWSFYTVPQTNCCQGFTGNRCPYPRGRGVGGSTLVNANMVVRSPESEHKQWEEMGLNWGYEDCLPYYKKAENFTQNRDDGPLNPDYHGTSGPFKVRFSNLNNSRTQAFLQGNVQMGIPIRDYNQATQKGTSLTQVNIDERGRRQDTGTAYIKPILDRPNLTVMTQSFVTKILFENDPSVASGVLFTYLGYTFKATARLEVILSAGAFQSPQLLMLSGIGPAAHLQSKNIPVLHDLEVGSALRDHHNLNLLYTHNATDDMNNGLWKQSTDYVNGVGELSAFSDINANAFLTTPMAVDDNTPDMEIALMTQLNIGLQNKVMKFDLLTAFGFSAGTFLQNVFMVYLINMPTVSTGTVRLASNSPYDYPLIDSNILSEQEDIDRMYEIILLFKKLLQTPAFKAINAQIPKLYFPMCDRYTKDSKDYWTCIFRQMVFPSFHPQGTCPMGLDTEKGAVVDSNLTVHGTKNLRVVDASVFPITTRNHPMVTLIMMGERIADVIKATYA